MFSRFVKRPARAAALMVALVLGSVIAPSAQALMVSSDSTVSVVAAARACTNSTVVGNRPTLQVGDTGSCVRVMQQLLLDHGYRIGTVSPDGYFYAKTEAAVLAFQKGKGLYQDSVVGPITWAALSSSGSAPPVPQGPNPSKAPVVLTYDDCPYGYSSAGAARQASNTTMKSAKDLGVHLRLYVTGNCLSANRFDVAYANQMGHTVCSHTNTHPDLRTLTLARVKAELTVPGLRTDCARPPYGAVNSTVRAAFSQLGYSLDLWSLDTNDWRGKSGAQVTNLVVSTAKPGDVVLMHMNHQAFNASSIKAMRDGLSQRGLAVK